MSDDKAEGAGKSPGGSKLESLSREDLIKFVKKQMLLLQRERAKSEDLKKKAVSAEGSAATQGGDQEAQKRIKDLEEQVSELTSERDDAFAAYNTVQASQESAAAKIHELEEQLQKLSLERDDISSKFATLSKANRELAEQVECMEIKDSSLRSSLQCMQEDQVKLAMQNKDLEDQLQEFKGERSEGEGQLVEVKAARDNLQLQVEELTSQLSVCKVNILSVTLPHSTSFKSHYI
ncbi:hypothetical protein V1264_010507 [Littorina saxatilis]|uniref:Uncharacterized protein n=1 Tax=Littorina saxatilis TaxID=31220 RepID=A0AAN9APM2_9CAEN